MPTSSEFEREPAESELVVARACIFDETGRILILRRSDKNSRGVGLWECPGGKKKPSESIESAFSRELYKETGLEAAPIAHFEPAPERIIPDGKYKGMTYKAHFAFIRVRDTSIRLSGEHDEFAWVNSSEVFEYALTDDTRKALEEFAPIINFASHMDQTG